MKGALLAILAILLGAIGLSLVFSDPAEGQVTRMILTGLYFLICGGAIGLLYPKAWMISGLTAWGAVLFGGFLSIDALRRYGGNAFGAEEPPYIVAGLVITLAPITLSLLGGYLGKLLRTKPESFS
jgi:hypothetical protein